MTDHKNNNKEHTKTNKKLKEKVKELLGEINKNISEFTPTFVSQNKQKYNKIISKISNLKNNFINLQKFNKLKESKEDLKDKKDKNIVFVKEGSDLVAILSKNLPKAIENPTSIKNVNLENSCNKTVNFEKLLKNKIFDLKDTILPENFILVDIKFHSYRTYECIPSFLVLVIESSLYCFEFDSKITEILLFLKNQKTKEIFSNKKTNIFLSEKYDFKNIKNIQKYENLFAKYSKEDNKKILYVDWRIRPFHLLKEYLFVDIFEYKNSDIYKFDKSDELGDLKIKEKLLFDDLNKLRDSLALENNESLSYILTDNQIKILLTNKEEIQTREDINSLLPFQSPIFRTHIYDFLLLFLNSNRDNNFLKKLNKMKNTKNTNNITNITNPKRKKSIE